MNDEAKQGSMGLRRDRKGWKRKDCIVPAKRGFFCMQKVKKYNLLPLYSSLFPTVLFCAWSGGGFHSIRADSKMSAGDPRSGLLLCTEGGEGGREGRPLSP